MSNIALVLITVGVMSAIFAIFLAVLLRYRHKPIGFDGFLNVAAQDVSQIYQLEITTDPSQLKNQKHISLKVRKIRVDEE